MVIIMPQNYILTYTAALRRKMRKIDYGLSDKITIARISLLPFMWIFAVYKYLNVLAILLIIVEIGDILDGYVARKLKQESKFGGKLDALSDSLVYISIFVWSFLIFPDIYIKNLPIVTILLIFIILPIIISIIKFKKIIFFHLISSKLLASTIIASFLALILFNNLLHYILPILSFMVVINSVERVIILLYKKVIYENIKSVFSLYKNKFRF